MQQFLPLARRRDMLAFSTIGLLLTTLRVEAADPSFPAKPIRLIIPFTPGGGTDFVARAISQPLTERWKQPFVIDNRAGAGGSIGMEELARSKPDGYTWGIGSAATITINPHVYAQKFNTLTDLVPVVHMAEAPNVLVVHPSLPARSLPELIAHAAKTRTLSAGTIIGSGTVSNLDRRLGSSCIAEQRMLEILEHGKAKTPFMAYGDVIRIEMKNQQGQNIFGSIEQEVRPLEHQDDA